MISDGPFGVHAKVASHGVSAPLTGEMDAIVHSPGDSTDSSGQLEVDFASDQVGDRDEIA
jgi:hypothetical protein